MEQEEEEEDILLLFLLVLIIFSAYHIPFLQRDFIAYETSIQMFT